VLKLPKKLKYFGCGLKHPQLYQSMTMYNWYNIVWWKFFNNNHSLFLLYFKLVYNQ
jgi:hypothetical protein